MFKIHVKLVKHNTGLTFNNVKEYHIDDKGFLTFIDNHEGVSKVKRFHPSNCEIEEEVHRGN